MEGIEKNKPSIDDFEPVKAGSDPNINDFEPIVVEKKNETISDTPVKEPSSSYSRPDIISGSFLENLANGATMPSSPSSQLPSDLSTLKSEAGILASEKTLNKADLAKELTPRKKMMDMVYMSPQGRYYMQTAGGKFSAIDQSKYESYPKIQQGDYKTITGGYLGFAEGGEVKGPGGPKDDRIPMQVAIGSFVVPVENAEKANALRMQYLPDGGKTKVIDVSNGEHIFTPEEVVILKSKGIDLNSLAPNANNKSGKQDGGEITEPQLSGNSDQEAGKAIVTPSGGPQFKMPEGALPATKESPRITEGVIAQRTARDKSEQALKMAKLKEEEFGKQWLEHQGAYEDMKAKVAPLMEIINNPAANPLQKQQTQAQLQQMAPEIQKQEAINKGFTQIYDTYVKDIQQKKQEVDAANEKLSTYLGGSGRALATSTKDMLYGLQGVNNFVNDYLLLGKAFGHQIDPNSGGYKILGDYIEKTADQNLENMPEGLAGETLTKAVGMIPITAYAMSPVGFVGAMALNDFGNEYQKSGNTFASLAKGGEGALTGAIFHGLGEFGVDVGRLATGIKSGPLNTLGATIAAAATSVGVGGYEAAHSLASLDTSGMTDEEKDKAYHDILMSSISTLGAGAVSSIPAIHAAMKVKPMIDFVQAPEEAIKQAIDTPHTTLELREKSMDLLNKAAEIKDENEKQQAIRAAQAIGTVANLKGQTEAITKNPQAELDRINALNISPEEKQVAMDKVQWASSEFDPRKQLALPHEEIIAESKRQLATPNKFDSPEVQQAKAKKLETIISDSQKSIDEIYSKPITETNVQEEGKSKEAQVLGDQTGVKEVAPAEFFETTDKAGNKYYFKKVDGKDVNITKVEFDKLNEEHNLKQQENAQANIERLPSGEPQGKAPVKEEPVISGGKEKIKRGGVFQAPEKIAKVLQQRKPVEKESLSDKRRQEKNQLERSISDLEGKLLENKYIPIPKIESDIIISKPYGEGEPQNKTITKNGEEYKYVGKTASRKNYIFRLDRETTNAEKQKSIDEQKQSDRNRLEYEKRKLLELNSGNLDKELQSKIDKKHIDLTEHHKDEIASIFYPNEKNISDIRNFISKEVMGNVFDAKGTKTKYIEVNGKKIRFSDHESRSEQDNNIIGKADRFRPQEYTPEDINIILTKNNRSGDAIIDINGEEYNIADYQIDNIKDLGEFVYEKIKKDLDLVSTNTSEKSDGNVQKHDEGGNKAEVTLDEQIQASKNKIKDLFKGGQKLGIAFDPKQEAESQYNLHKELVNLAKLYIQKGVRTVADFAKELALNLEDAKRAWDEANDVKKYTVEDFEKEKYDTEGMKMRGFPERIKELPDYKKAKAEIEANPELQYKPQELKDVKEKLADMTDQEKLDAMSDVGKIAAIGDGDNFGVLAGIDLLNKAMAEGKDYKPILETLSRAGTTMGQLIRQFAELKGSTPEGLVKIFEAELEKHGKELTQEQRAELEQKAKEHLEAMAKYKEQAKVTEAEFTDKNIQELDRLKKEAEGKYIGMANLMQELTPRKFWDIMGTILQGNLLTPMSQVANISYNLAAIPVRTTGRAIMTPVDALYSFVTGKPRTLLTNKGTTSEYMKGMGLGTAEAFKQIKTGIATADLNKMEIQRGFRPLIALAQAFTGKNLPVNSKGKIEIKDRVNKLIEGTFGIPAESMFRLLNLGDKPFYRATERQSLYEIAKTKKLSGKDLEKFIMFPDKKSYEKAESLAKQATFQEETVTSKLAVNMLKAVFDKLESVPYIGGALKFIAKTQFPYVKTPANVISQTMDYAVPPISFAKGLYEASKGNRREALINIGKASVGTMIITAADLLYEQGIISGSADEEEKKRQLQYQVMPPNSVNASALKRFLNGEGTAAKDGDEIINYNKMGVVGAIFNIRSNIGEENKKIDMKSSSELTKIINTLPASAAFTLEQSFLKGSSALLDAIKDKKWDNWLTNTFGAITSIPLPNTLAAVNRANREYLPSLRGDNLEDRLNNIVKNKLFQTDDLPIKVNMWGEKIKQTPQGANAWSYQLFDVTKGQEIRPGELSFEIKNLYEKTQDSDVIPNVPPRDLSEDNVKTRLTDAQYQKYLSMVGKKRKEEADKLIRTDYYKGLSDDKKIEALVKSYSDSRKKATDELKINMGLKKPLPEPRQGRQRQARERLYRQINRPKRERR